MNILILHGIGGHSGIHWQQWLHDSAVTEGHAVIMPELPDSGHPDRQTWLNTVKSAVANVSLKDLVIVAHSLDVPTALDFIEQADGPVQKLVSVSGFAKPYGAELNEYFLAERTIDFDKVRANLGSAAVFYGNDDPYVTQEALRNLADELRVETTVIPGGGHLNTESGYTQFPALMESINS